MPHPGLHLTKGQTLLQDLGDFHEGFPLGNLLAFCRALRSARLDVPPGRVIDVCRSLEHIELRRRADFKQALKANLVSSREDERVFEQYFRIFFQPYLFEEQESPGEGDAMGSDVTLDSEGQVMTMEGPTKGMTMSADRLKQDVSEMQGEAVLGYTGEDILVEKDFSGFTDEEVRELRRIIQRLAPKLATTISRRTHADHRGHRIDFRRTFRRNLRHGGDPLHLARRERKLKRLKLILLCDVSGSMDRYSVFLIQFLYALQRELRGLETFVFSTRLVEVTATLRTKEFEKALQEMRDRVETWSGGTSIGRCLQHFNQRRARRMTTTRTVVVIISDGWDKGDATLMRNEMQTLRRRCRRVIWLNPLLGAPSYQPLAQGMQAALPYIDYFLPAHNLQSLIALTKTLRALRG